MTVKEFIEILESLPQDVPVYLYDYSDDTDTDITPSAFFIDPRTEDEQGYVSIR